ncbi:MAG TPA: SCO family protein [Longimicrobiaceae bacterium]|jgi:protein SCO1/2
MTPAMTTAPTEVEFAARVDALAADPRRGDELLEMLREDHAAYDQRGAATTARMRGWVLLALARHGLPEAGLIFVLEELDTGTDAYLVAAAARALRSFPDRRPEFAPFLAGALDRIRSRDEPVDLERYGRYAASPGGTSAARELLASLAWLGPGARGMRARLEALRAEGGSPRGLRAEWDHALAAIGSAEAPAEASASCCSPPLGFGAAAWRPRPAPGDADPFRETVFEDHAGDTVTFPELFVGRPSIVVFFYTRCDNPSKCSLTITRLARVQEMLRARGLADAVNTAAVTYDPAFDGPERLRRYAEERGVRLGPGHRALRPTAGFDALRRYLGLGVNFTGSLVSRHRIEAYVLDARGRVAALFERVQWEEAQLVERAVEVLRAPVGANPPEASAAGIGRRVGAPVLGTSSALALALFPKCPVCWAAYLSMAGVAGLERIPYAPWLQWVLAAVLAVNLAVVGHRGRASGRAAPFCLAAAGALVLLASRLAPGWEAAAPVGVGLTGAGTLLGVFTSMRSRSRPAAAAT